MHTNCEPNSVLIGAAAWLQPCWGRFGSDWVFLLILGIVMALISSVLDLAIEKCQTGKEKSCYIYTVFIHL